MSKKTNFPNTLIPESLKRIFSVTPLLKYEDRHAYDDLMSQVIVSLIPNDAIKWLFVKQHVDGKWEFLRYYTYKTALMDNSIKNQLDEVLRLRELPQTRNAIEQQSMPQANSIVEQESENVKEKQARLIRERELSPYFTDGPRDYNTIYGAAILRANIELEQIDALIRGAEYKCKSALKSLFQYRADRASFGRSTTPRTIDAEDADVQDLSAARAVRKAKKPA